MAVHNLELQDQYVGDDEPLTIKSTVASGDDRGDPYVPSAADALVYDPLRSDELSGDADADGTTTSFVSADLADLTDDFLNGMPVRVTQAADDNNWAETIVVDYVSASGTLTLRPLPWAVSSGDTLEVLGYPLVTLTDVTDNIGGDDGNEVYLETTGSNAHSYTNKDGDGNGKRVAIFYLTFAANRKDTCRCTYDVLPR